MEDEEGMEEKEAGKVMMAEMGEVVEEARDKDT